MATQTEVATLRAPRDWGQIDLYRFFAFVFGAPSAERFAWLRRPDLGDSLARLWQALGCASAFPGIRPFSAYAEYESTYIGLFDVGSPEPPVPLLESAHCKTQPAPQTVLENVSFYEVLGLRINPTRGAADHLVTQLEFLSAVRYTSETTPDAENRRHLVGLERDFLERHLLNWLPAVKEKLERELPPTFPVLLALLLAFLYQRRQELAQVAPMRGDR
jgi:DMSO reductase family type II enzyme chaperone